MVASKVAYFLFWNILGALEFEDSSPIERCAPTLFY
jgi:hypothetical protein